MASGWECSRCGRSWAPHVDECRKCVGGEIAPALVPAGPTFRELWDVHYAPWAELHLRKTWGPVRKAHRKSLVGFFGDLPWTALTHAKADEYIAWRLTQRTVRKGAPKPATLNSELASLKACLTWCLSGAPRGQCPISGTSPMDGYPALPVADERNFSIAEGDFVRILEHSRPMLRLILIFGLETGMRRDEFRLLQWHEIEITEPINGQDKRAVVKLAADRTKAGKAREVPLSDVALAVLKAVPRYSRSKWVFENPKQNNLPLSKTSLHRWFVAARKAANVHGPRGQEIWVHSVRKTFGTSKAMSGMPIYMLMDIMGHSSPDVHFGYTKMSPEYHGQARDFLNGRRGAHQAALPPVESEREPARLLRFVKPE